MNHSTEVLFFVKAMFWAQLVGVVCRLIFLSINEYPRSIRYSPVEDALYVLLGAGFAAWMAWAAWW